ASDAVIHRQAVVDAVGWGGAHQAGKPVGPLHDPAVADDGRFRQTGRTRRVNVKSAIVDGNGLAFAVGQGVAAEAFDRAIDSLEASMISTVYPDSGRGGYFGQRRDQLFDESLVHDHMLGRRHVDAVGQRTSGEV